MKNRNLEIEINKTDYRWSEFKGESISVYFVGFFWLNDHFYSNEDAINYLITVYNDGNSFSESDEILNSLNGSWSIIILRNGEVFLASDVIRAFPIFYYVSDEKIVITDAPNFTKNLKNREYSEDNIYHYLKTGACLPGETVIKDFYDVTAGGYIHINQSLIVEKLYWMHPEIIDEVNHNKLLNKINDNFNNVFSRMKKKLEMSNSIVFLPLSGGMDSRLLAWALKKYKIKNRIICFSYGVDSDVEEARISSQIANELGFEWEFIQYTKENWKNLRMKFGELSSKIVDVKSIIHLQDYLSVKYLTDKYGEGIFLPGLCFDVLAGYTIPDIFSFNNNIPIQNVLYEGFYKKDKIEEIINSELTRLNNYELFIKNSRLSSFIVNSIRIYENFGCEFYLPFWDLELVNFWYSIPLNDRINRNIFRSYINSFAYINEYSELLNIPVTGGRTQKDKYSIPNFLDKIDIFKRRYKNIIKKKIPISILNYIGKNIDYSKSDYLGFYNFIFSDLETRRLILKNDYLDFELINVTSYHYDSLLALITLAEMNIPISQEIIRKIYCNG